MATEKKLWDKAYVSGMTMWEPQESIVIFSARYLKRREDLDRWTVHRKAETVLDLGCGNGSNARFFALQGFKSFGADIAVSAIKLGQKWFASEGVPGHLTPGSCMDLPYKDRAFDVVVSHGVLDHMYMRDGLKTMSEVRRVLRPHGLCFLTLVSTDDCEFGRGEPSEHNVFVLKEGYETGLPQHYFDTEEIKQLMEGFEILDLRRAEIAFGATQGTRHARWQVTAEVL